MCTVCVSVCERNNACTTGAWASLLHLFSTQVHMCDHAVKKKNHRSTYLGLSLLSNSATASFLHLDHEHLIPAKTLSESIIKHAAGKLTKAFTGIIQLDIKSQHLSQL